MTMQENYSHLYVAETWQPQRMKDQLWYTEEKKKSEK